MKKILILITVFLLSNLISAQTTNVAAAANLRNVLNEIKSVYLKKFPKERIDITYGSSGNLMQQILNGGSFDLFMSADKELPLKLKEKGVTIGNVTTYAYGKLVLWSSTLNVKAGASILTQSTIKKIAIANPKIAPYGERSVEFLKKKGLYEKLQEKIVFADNISQTAQFAYTGNVEIAFTAMSMVLSPEMKKAGKYYIIPESEYSPIEQACVLLRKREQNPAAAKFMQFVLDPKLKAIWEKWGYRSIHK